MPRWFSFFVAAVFCCGALGLTGSSWLVAVRHDRLLAPAERKQEELSGTSRPIRSDEWAVQTPQVRAQQVSRPRFALVNLAEGNGALQRNPYDLPVLDWGLPFRPLTWPCFVPAPWSNGMQWFLRDVALLMGIFFLLAAFLPQAGGRGPVAAAGSLAIFFSSAASWWRSTVMIEFIALAAAAGAAGAFAARVEGRQRAGLLALSAWLWACSFAVFYPPVWAPTLWIVCAVVVDAHRERGRAVRALPALGAVASGGAVGLLYHLPYLSLVSQTAYPGRRIAQAGTLPASRLIELFWPSLTAAAPAACEDRYLGHEASNVCEASAVEAIPLLLAVALALADPGRRRALADLLRTRPAMVLACALLAAWMFLPLPESAGLFTLLRWSPPPRAFVAFGVGCAFLAAHLVAGGQGGGAQPVRRAAAVAVDAAVLGGCALLAGRHIHTPLPTRCRQRAFWPPVALTAALLLLAAFWTGTRRGAALLMAAWVAPLALANAAVNPLLRSSQLFRRGSGHAAIDRAFLRAPGKLIDYGTHPGAELAAFGWPLIGGVQEAPDVALFRFLVPKLPPEAYNRYAHVSFALPPARSEVPQPDVVRVAISPCSRRLAAVGVNHLLAWGDAALPPECAAQFEVAEAGSLRLWSRRSPVCPFGVARGRKTSALDYEFGCAGAQGARLEPGVLGFRVAVPNDPSLSWAIAMNPSVIDSVECTGAAARFMDAHLVVEPDGTAEASCRGRYLDSLGALRRLLARR